MRDFRVLQKDLPFENLKAGTVISFTNNKFIVECGNTWYEGNPNSTSHNGWRYFEEDANSILNLIWDNTEWFKKPLITAPIKWSRSNNRITLIFNDNMDLDVIESITKGIRTTLVNHYKSHTKNMGWDDERIDIQF